MLDILFFVFIIVVVAVAISIAIVITYLWLKQKTKELAQELAQEAKVLLGQDTNNPFEIDILSKALKLYQESDQLVDNSEVKQAAREINREIELRLDFQNFFNQAKELVEQKYFQQALVFFQQAKLLYSLPVVDSRILNCQLEATKEETYKFKLKQAYYLSKDGKFRDAANVIKTALLEFERLDGKTLLQQFKKVIQGQEQYEAGLIAEKTGEFYQAIAHYQEAIRLIPELTKAKISLAILAIKNQDFITAIEQLKNINEQQAIYLKGFIYARQKKWNQALKEWQSINNQRVQEQCEIINNLMARERLATIKGIEELVEQGELQEAKLLSLHFLEKFGPEKIVKNNIEEHIQPRLELEMWKTQDWEKIATITKLNWLQSQDINSLHNWAVASYYQTQHNPDKLPELIIPWSSALAQINNHPSLKDLPWLGNNSINMVDVFQRLNNLLEDLIDEIKEKDVREYFQLRDRYRQESAALRFLQNEPNAGVRVKELVITPGCYLRYQEHFPHITLPVKLWATLYTDWGAAVAACLEGDSCRAIEIKPIEANSSLEKLASSFVSYYEGCYYLQQENWRKAIAPLLQAKNEIKYRLDWIAEIDRLCLLQRQKIESFYEHLDLAQFWYELLASQAAKSYYAEYQARIIADQLVNQKISEKKALSELKMLKDIDADNPIVIDLISRIEIVLEAENIKALLKKGNFEDAMTKAQNSCYQQVRYQVAQLCLEILLEGSKTNNLDVDDVYKLGRWAYNLCPDEPDFQDIYLLLGIGDY